MKGIGKIIMYLVITVIIISVGYFLYQASKDKTQNDNEDKKTAIVEDTKSHPQQGNQQSKVTVVEFGDYLCPYCQKFDNDIIPKLEKSYIETNKISFRYVQVPLHGEASQITSRAAYAIQKFAPEKFWQYHHDMYQFANGKDQSQIKSFDDIEPVIENLNLDKKTFENIKQETTNDKSDAAKKLANDKQYREKYNVKQVPTLVINGKVVEENDFDKIKDEIDEALENNK